MSNLLAVFTDGFLRAQQAVFESIVQPLLFKLGLGGLIEDAFDATGWLLIGVIEIAVLLLLIRPLGQQLLGLHRLGRALKPGRRRLRWERHD